MKHFDSKKMDPERIKHMNRYYSGNASKLHKVVNRILRKFGGIKDYDEYYSLANEVFLEVLMNYDGKRNFDSFLYSCLYKRICSNVTKMNCSKRRNSVVIKKDGTEEKIYLDDYSFDAPIQNEDGTGTDLKDLLSSDYIIEDHLSEDIGLQKSENVDRYLNRLSKKQREIVESLIDGESPGDIRKRMGLTYSQYQDHMLAIRATRNTKFLYGGR